MDAKISDYAKYSIFSLKYEIFVYETLSDIYNEMLQTSTYIYGTRKMIENAAKGV